MYDLTLASVKRDAREAVRDPGDFHRLLNAYIRDLADAKSTTGVVAALSDFGAVFGLPHIDVFESRLDGEPGNVEVWRSPRVPQAILDALYSHPLAAWAMKRQTPIFVSEADQMLAMRGTKRPPVLEAVEALLVNLDIAPGRVRHFGFVGERGLANGLSRSALHLAARLAHERISKSSWPVDARVVLTAHQRVVLNLAMTGLTDREIGDALGLTTRTVRFHLRNMQRRLGAPTRSELIAHAAQRISAERQ